MKRILALITVALFLGLAGAASASITLQEIGVTPPNVVNVTIQGSYDNGVSVYAGQYVLNITDTSNTWTGTYNGFCVDPAAAPGSFAPYSIVPVANVTGVHTASNNNTYLAEAAYVFSKYGAADSTATQLAIWELVFDATPSDLTSGGFKVNAGDASIINQAKVELADALANGAGFNTAGYYIAENPGDGSIGQGTQDYMIYRSVPEPSILLFLGAGLLGIGGLSRWIRYRR